MNDTELEALLANRGQVSAPQNLWPRIAARARIRRIRRIILSTALPLAAALVLVLTLNRPVAPRMASLESYMEETLGLFLPEAPNSGAPAILNLDTLNAPATSFDDLTADAVVAFLEI